MERIVGIGRRALLVAVPWCVWLAAAPLGAQPTGGAVEARLRDEQGLPLAGVLVTLANPATGLQRSTVSDSLGWARSLRLPIGAYELQAAIAGFSPVLLRELRVEVDATTRVEIRMALATKAEQVAVTAEAPLVDAERAGVGAIVTRTQIENLPLNGRQFGNLAALVPGVGLGFHNDPTKSSQYAPQVSGGTGRNVNYQVDGGDDNDDTVGGLAQGYPLDAISEFNLSTHRFRAEYGRSDGAVLSVVTRSGTNTLAGSAFDYFRDRSLNARTETEKRNGEPRGDYRRWQFGGSLGGPIRKDRTHFFLSFERTQQDTTQPVDTGGLFPEKDGVFALPARANTSLVRLTHQLGARELLSLRYGFANDSEIVGANPQSPPESWGTSTNTYHSMNASLSSTLRANLTNEALVQFSYFFNHIGSNSNLPTQVFPGGVLVGQNPETPQATLQKKLQLKDDLMWVRGRHEVKGGVSLLFVPALESGTPASEQSTVPYFVLLEDRVDSPVSEIGIGGPIGGSGGFVGARLPNQQYGLYLEDAWRVTDRLRLDLGLRYDLVVGTAFDQGRNRVFRDLQQAARAGRLAGIAGLEDFGPPMTEDTNDVAPRIGFTYDWSGRGRVVLRGGYGRYFDIGFTNSYVLFPASDTQSSWGLVYYNSDSTGIRNADGSSYQVGQPLPPNQAVVSADNNATNVASPLVRQPYTDQANLGLSLSLGADYALELNAVGSWGRDLGVALDLNSTPDLGPRRFADLLPNVGTVPFLVWTPRGESRYRALSASVEKRWNGKLQFLASYTLSSARSTARATDDFGGRLLDATQPFAAAQFGPSLTDARHRVTASEVWSPGAGITIASIFRLRSALPYTIVAGTDLNLDGVNFDLPPGVHTVRAGRGSRFSQLDVRLSKRVALGGRTHLVLLGEVFNLWNAANPDGFVGNRLSPQFAQPTAFSGDAGLGEQRLAQLGLRVEF